MSTKLNLPSIIAALCVVAAFGLSACSSNSEYQIGAPSGWQANGTEWWIPGTDTSLAFRPMKTLEEMGVSGTNQVFVAGGGITRQSSADQSVRAVKQNLLPLFRNEPQIVDSLFTALVEEKIRNNPFPQTGFEESVKKQTKSAMSTIRRIFHQPFPKKRIGKDVVIVYPDSLSKAGIRGNVVTQVYMNKAGEPIGVKLVTAVHPVLDDIAMKASTEMIWQPAYLLTASKSNPVPAWVRYNVNFTQTQSR